MQHTLQTTQVYSLPVTGKMPWTAFIEWCAAQESSRYTWMGFILFFQGSVMAPFSMFALSMGDASLFLWALPVVAVFMCLVPNLAALPTKFTLPIFFASLVLNAIAIFGGLLG